MTTLVQHRAVTPDGTVLLDVMMVEHERWIPYADCYPGDMEMEHEFQTCVLPDGEWGPSAVICQPGYPLVVIARWTL